MCDIARHTLAFGIPTTPESFENDLLRARGGHLAKINRHRSDLFLTELAFARIVADNAVILGANVVFDVTINEVGELFQSDHVVTLFAHWKSDVCDDGPIGLELRDGIHTADAIASIIASPFRGLVDLSVCHSIHLAETLKKRHPESVYIANTGVVNLEYRLAMYDSIIAMVASGTPYLNATFEVRRMFRGDKR